MLTKGHSVAYIAETKRHREDAQTELAWAHEILVRLHERVTMLKRMVAACDAVLALPVEHSPTDDKSADSGSSD